MAAPSKSKKKAKKVGPPAKQTAAPLKVNPFDLKSSKRKFSVLGKRVKNVEKNVLQARNEAVQRRKKTLLIEYSQLRKANLFVDRRFGENDDSLTEEDKALARLQAQRVRQTKKQGVSKFNLEEDTTLTHFGRSLDDDDAFYENLPSANELDADIVDELVQHYHFGGGSDDGKGGASLAGKLKTRKQIMEEIIAKSKMYKAMKQQQKEADEDQLKLLNSEFSSLVKASGFVALLKPPKSVGGSVKEGVVVAATSAEDAKYDMAARELVFEAKGQAGERTLTTEELAEQERARLEQLEKARMKRMRQDEDEDDDNAGGFAARRKRLSAMQSGDALEDDFADGDEDDDDDDESEGEAAIGDGGTVLDLSAFEQRRRYMAAGDHPLQKAFRQQAAALLKKYGMQLQGGDGDEGVKEGESIEKDEENEELESQQGGNEGESEEREEEEGTSRGEDDQGVGVEEDRDRVGMSSSGTDEENESEDDDDDEADEGELGPKLTEALLQKHGTQGFEAIMQAMAAGSSSVEQVGKGEDEEGESEADEDASDVEGTVECGLHQHAQVDKARSPVDNGASKADKAVANTVSKTGRAVVNFDSKTVKAVAPLPHSVDDERPPAAAGALQSVASTSGWVAGFEQEAAVLPELPYTIPVPSSYPQFAELVKGRSAVELLEAIKRIRVYNAMELATDSKLKLQMLYGILTSHFALLAGEQPLQRSLLDAMVPVLLEMTGEVPVYAATVARVRLKKMDQRISAAIAMRQSGSASSWPACRYLLLLKLLFTLFPTSDRRHPVTTPAALLCGKVLSHCPVTNPHEAAVGLAFASLSLHCAAPTKRHCPEVLAFLARLLKHALPPGTDASGDHTPILSLTGACQKEALHKLDLFHVVSGDPASEEFTTEMFKLGVLLGVVKTVQRAAQLYSKSHSFPQSFQTLASLLRSLAMLRALSKDLKFEVNSTLALLDSNCQFIIAQRHPMVQEHRVKSLAFKEQIPRFEEGYFKGRDYDPDRERASQRRLKREVNKEKRGAMRELRKDSAFMAEERIRQKRQVDAERLQSERRFYSELQSQASDLKSGGQAGMNPHLKKKKK